MFGKKDQDANQRKLADRMKTVSGGYAPVPEEQEYTDTHIRGNKRDPRTPTYKHATIQLRGGERLEVVVKNVSASGARIEYFRNVPLSDVVYLMEPTLKIRTWADVVWEKSGVAGIRFIDG